MFCRNCGFQIGEQQRFCSNCGADNGGMGVGQSYNPMNTVSNPTNTIPAHPVVGILGMKWYKFLIYFALFVAGALNIISGIMYLTGSIYGAMFNGMVDAEEVYTMLGSDLKTLDIIFGICAIGLGIDAFVVRSKLAAYKSDGPKYWYMFYSISLGVSTIYNLISTAIIDDAVGEYAGEAIGTATGASVIMTVIIGALLVWANVTYFNKRKHLFVN